MLWGRVRCGDGIRDPGGYHGVCLAIAILRRRMQGGGGIYEAVCAVAASSAGCLGGRVLFVWLGPAIHFRKFPWKFASLG